jgi:hypothetical protein
MEKYPEDPKEMLEKEIRAALIGFGWPAATAEYRHKENPTQYFQEVLAWQWKRRSQEDPELTHEEVQEELEENWGKVSSLYERNRIRIQGEGQKVESPVTNPEAHLTVEVLRRLNAEMKAKYLGSKKREESNQREQEEQGDSEKTGGTAIMQEAEKEVMPKGNELKYESASQEISIEEQSDQKVTPADRSPDDLPIKIETSCGPSNQEIPIEEQPMQKAIPAEQPSEEQSRKNLEE